MKKYMKSITLLILFLLNISIARSATTLTELNSKILSSEKIGPLNTETIEKIHDILGESSHDHFIIDALDKLGFDNPRDLSLIVQVCGIQDPRRYGTYSRGTQSSRKLSLEHSISIFAEEWGAGIEEKISKSYRHNYIEGKLFNVLVIQKWPTICLRQNLTLLEVTTTLVHELVHYINDDYLYDANLSTESEYMHDILHSPGGEYEAFEKEILLKADLDNTFGTTHRLVNNFYNDGHVDKESLSDYILKILRYEVKFSRNYKTLLLEKHSSLLASKKYIGSLVDLYEQNVEIHTGNLDIVLSNRDIFISNISIFENNLPIFNSNISIHESNIELFQRRLDRALDNADVDEVYVQELEDRIEDTQQRNREEQGNILNATEQLESSRSKLQSSDSDELKVSEQILFYENLLTLAKEESDVQAIQLQSFVETHIDSNKIESHPIVQDVVVPTMEQ
jgi:hypothetical protein